MKAVKFDKKDFLYHKGLSHPKRIEILNKIIEFEEGISLTELYDRIKMPMQTLDFHLHTLKSCNLVRSKRRNKNILYYPNIGD